MRKRWCVLTAFAACVIAACNTERPTAARPRFARLAGVVDSTQAVLNPAWAQEIKGWGLYPAGEDGGFNGHPAADTAVYSMHETFIRDKLDGRLYVSGLSLSDMVINTSLLDIWIAKWQDAQSHGVDTLMLSIWSPPAAFKTNGSLDGYINGDTVIADSNNVGYLKAGAETSFVYFVVKALQYIQSKGIHTVAISMQNEPNKVVNYDGCIYTNHYSQWQYVIKTAYYYFGTNNLSSVKILGPEPSHYESGMPYLGGTNFAELKSDSYLDSAIGAYAWHSYQTSGANDVANGIAMVKKDSWMTEYGYPVAAPATGTKLDLGYTITTFGHLGADLVLVPNNYWAEWQSWLNNDNNPPDSSTLTDGTGSTIYLSKRYILFKKLWQMVQPGWSVRTYASTTDPDLKINENGQDTSNAVIQMYGFANPTNNVQVMVFVNPTTKDKAIQISAFDTNYKDQNSWRTDTMYDTIPQAGSNVYKGYSTVSVPHRSIVLARLFVPGH